MDSTYYDVRLASSNVSHRLYSTAKGARPWSSRVRDLTTNDYRDCTVLLLQECDGVAAQDICKLMPGTWQYDRTMIGHRLNTVAWNADKFELVEAKDRIALTSPKGAQTRSLEIVTLKHKETGIVFSYGSSHLATDKDAGGSIRGAYWRNKQMAEIVNKVKYLNGRIVIGMDVNSTATGATSPRGVMSRAGFTAIRLRTKVYNATMNSFGGWGKGTQKYQGKWLDEVFTTDKVKVHSGSVENTGTASDHNVLRVSMRVYK